MMPSLLPIKDTLAILKARNPITAYQQRQAEKMAKRRAIRPPRRQRRRRRRVRRTKVSSRAIVRPRRISSQRTGFRHRARRGRGLSRSGVRSRRPGRDGISRKLMQLPIKRGSLSQRKSVKRLLLPNSLRNIYRSRLR